jgi:glycosyltransferase involved in cell wall biosynthesis
MALRVAIVHPSFVGVGGAEILALSQARCLRDLGFDVRVVTCVLDEQSWRDQLDGLPVDVLGTKDWIDKLGGNGVWLARRSRRLAEALSNVDVAIAHNYPMSRMLASIQSTAKKIWYCNEPNREIHLIASHPVLEKQANDKPKMDSDAIGSYLNYRQRLSNPFRATRHKMARERRRDLASIDGLNILCANSNFGKELAVRTYGPRPFRVLHPIVRFAERRWVRAGLDRKELRILVHTRLEYPKNVETVFRGFSRFIAKQPQRAILHVVGQGASQSKLAKLASDLRIEQSMIFHGFLPDAELRSIYDRCEVFALLPIDEPFGMVFPEAASRGLLLVGPDHGGPFEIMEQGKIGFASNAFSAEGLADNLERIVALSDPQVDELREAADMSCRARFSAATIGPQMVAVYELT